MTAPLQVKVIVCNYAEGTPAVPVGSKAYVRWTPGIPDRLPLLVRSRSGRWIEKWEGIRRLTNFRLVTLVADDPRFGQLQPFTDSSDDEVQHLVAAKAEFGRSD